MSLALAIEDWLTEERTKMKKLALIILGCLLVGATAFASPLCAPDTYATYATAGFSCTIGGLLFDNFSLSSTGNPPGVAVPAVSIAVTPIATPGNEGLQFSAGWLVAGTNAMNSDSLIQFRVSSVSGAPGITGLGLSFNGSTIGNGSSVVVETFGVGGLIFVSNPPGILSASASFAPTTSVLVSKDIDVAIFGSPAEVPLFSNAHISFVTNTFSNNFVPEPVTMILLGTGLMGIGALGRRRKK